MKRIMSGIYAFIFRFTGSKLLALVLGLFYITFLTLVTIYGLMQLLEGIAPRPVMVVFTKLSKFPGVLFSIPLMFFINYLLISPIKNLEKDKRNQDNYWPVVIYTIIVMVILAYIHYGYLLFT